MARYGFPTSDGQHAVRRCRDGPRSDHLLSDIWKAALRLPDSCISGTIAPLTGEEIRMAPETKDSSNPDDAGKCGVMRAISVGATLLLASVGTAILNNLHSTIVSAFVCNIDLLFSAFLAGYLVRDIVGIGPIQAMIWSNDRIIARLAYRRSC